MTVLDGVWTPIMSLPSRLHGDVGVTMDVYGHYLGREPLSGSLSSSMIWRRSLCARLVGRAGEDGGLLAIPASPRGRGGCRGS